MLWGILIAVVAVVAFYAIWGRQWLKKQPWAQKFFALVDPLELTLFKKSETILVGRLLWISGLLVTVYDAAAVFISSLDLTPLTTRIFDWLQVPLDMRNLLATAFIGILGLLINQLRMATTKPLELVAVPAAAVTPEVAETMAAADEAKQQAVAAVAEAKH
ncbi:hypothetical protein ACE102_33660 [Bradyrhizobium sp. vgs-9]|uniref:hypothetical protein n=1 Tax=Bradyrhizobium sp. vgs-9 TaxID=208389 RepID=UPI0035D4C26F